jgi:hypothetical protein
MTYEIGYKADGYHWKDGFSEAWLVLEALIYNSLDGTKKSEMKYREWPLVGLGQAAFHEPWSTCHNETAFTGIWVRISREEKYFVCRAIVSLHGDEQQVSRFFKKCPLIDDLGRRNSYFKYGGTIIHRDHSADLTLIGRKGIFASLRPH